MCACGYAGPGPGGGATERDAIAKYGQKVDDSVQEQEKRDPQTGTGRCLYTVRRRGTQRVQLRERGEHTNTALA